MYTKKDSQQKQQELQYTRMQSRSAQKETSSKSASPKAPLSEEEKARRAAKRRAAAKKRARQRQRRVLLSSVLFFLIAVSALVWSISLLVKKRAQEAVLLPSAASSVSPSIHADGSTPAPGSQVKDTDVLPAGTRINGVAVGGQAAAQVRSLLAQELNKTLDGIAITLQNDSFNYTLTKEDLQAAYDIESALISAMKGGSVQAPLSYDETALREVLYTLNDQVPGHATNASFTIEKETYSVGDKTSGYKEYQKPSFKYTEGTDGMQLDYDGVVDQVAAALNAGTLQTTISPDVTVSKPTVTVADVQKQTTKLAGFSTDYYFTTSGSSTTAEELTRRQNRDHNISKATGLMNVIQLEPGESFSFNKTTGERSEKKGWALAPAVYRGSHRAEPGGGVCQVSTTIFNALLRSGVDVTNHKEHSLPSDYVDNGMDATVNYGSIDFRFKNNKSSTLYVFVYITKCKSSSHKKTINVEVYGPEEPGVTYQVISTCVEENPAVNPTTKPNRNQYTDYAEVIQKAYDGSSWEVKVYKVQNGQKTMVYDYVATYPKIEQVTEVGTKPIPTEKPTPTPFTPTPAPDPGEGEHDGE